MRSLSQNPARALVESVADSILSKGLQERKTGSVPSRRDPAEGDPCGMSGRVERTLRLFFKPKSGRRQYKTSKEFHFSFYILHFTFYIFKTASPQKKLLPFPHKKIPDTQRVPGKRIRDDFGHQSICFRKNVGISISSNGSLRSLDSV